MSRSSNVQFVDYCSFTFHAFRTSAGLLPESYKTSLARPRNSRFKLGGTSGAFIFFSDDNRFVIKQIQTNEFNTLLKILPSYLKHMRTHPESMLQHMYQLRRILVYKPKDVNQDWSPRFSTLRDKNGWVRAKTA